jgi:hypothetical protein
VRILFVILAVLLVVPGWSAEERGARVTPGLRIVTSRVALDPDDPTRVTLGGLRYLGGIRLNGDARSFGGFSALAVRGERFMLLSDGGLVLRFTLGADWRLRGVRWHALPGGPRTGWDKRDRDSESLVVDAAADRAWIGFESANAIWRYSADLGRVDAIVAPRAMRDWRSNGGAESLARLADGRFVAIAETSRVAARDWRGSEAARRRTREMLIFARDPLAGGAVGRAAYLPTEGHHVVDAVAVPGGDLLVLERAFRLPYRFANRVMRVAARDLAAGKVIRGRAIAALAPPLIHDNFEGMAITREGGATILWLVSDDNQSMLQRTLLLKFALEEAR